MNNSRKYRGASGPAIIMFIVIVVAELWPASLLSMHQQAMTCSVVVPAAEPESATEVYIEQSRGVRTGMDWLDVKVYI